jgi:hypothetical protein
VSARIFQPLTHVYTWSDNLREAGVFLGQFWDAFLGGGVLLVLVGAAWLLRRNVRFAAFLLLAALPQTLFFINYAAFDKETMFLGTYVIAALVLACGIAALQHERLTHWLAVAAVAGLVILLVRANLPLVDVSDDWRARDRAEQFFGAAAPDSLAIGYWTDLAPLEFLQAVEHQRPDVQLVYAWWASRQVTRTIIEATLAAGRPVYLLRSDPQLIEGLVSEREQYWYRLEEDDARP